MSDFFEVDFLDVESDKSGDAIALRYEVNGSVYIHVVDAGFQDTGGAVVGLIKKYYGNPTYIDHVISTHPDGDHAGGLRKVLEEFRVGELWMLRPWAYAEEIIHRFSRVTSAENLVAHLKQCYPNIVALEEIAEERGITIREPFQGAQIGAFTAMAPTRERYLELVCESERTPESLVKAQETSATRLAAMFERAVAKAVSMVKAAWGVEVFSSDPVSAENEMSVVQYANLCGTSILLTADAGLSALSEAADYAPNVGLALPGIKRFQVPHHGSRRNVSTALLDRWLGTRLPSKVAEGMETFTAIISSAKKDVDHPRKAVVRALIHRGAKVVATEGRNIRTAKDAPPREGWDVVSGTPYPQEQEN